LSGGEQHASHQQLRPLPGKGYHLETQRLKFAED
jgi:hypothetical protein